MKKLIIYLKPLEGYRATVYSAWKAPQSTGPDYLKMYIEALDEGGSTGRIKTGFIGKQQIEAHAGLLKLYLDRDQSQQDLDELKNEILDLPKTSVGTEVETLRSEVASTSIDTIGRNTTGNAAKALHEQGVIKI